MNTTMEKATSAALIINLGSPASTKVSDVKTYLGEFLMDENVIDYPYFLRAILVKGIILNVRPKKSAEAYETIWWDEGSPLIVLSERLQASMQEKIDTPIFLAMRYANPSIPGTLNAMREAMPNLKKVFVIPLYPHYAMSSYGTVKDRVAEVAKKEHSDLEVVFQPPFYEDNDYIKVLANSIKEKLPEDHHLLFSYHGIPVRHLKKTDPSKVHCARIKDCCNVDNKEVHAVCYKHQTQVTSLRVAEELGLSPDQYSTSYQSRLGLAEWIRPYTAKEFERMPKDGIKKLAVVCPAFVSDCLETLEEIYVEGKEDFMHAGGESFVTIPCLNTQEDWVNLLVSWVRNHCDIKTS